MNEIVEAADEKVLAKTIARYGRVDLLCIDLCRARDYAEAGASPGWCAESSRVAGRHSYRLSRNARTLSVGWYRPGLADVGVVRARVFSLIMMSAWTYASVDRTPAWPSQRAIIDASTPCLEQGHRAAVTKHVRVDPLDPIGRDMIGQRSLRAC